MDKYSVFLSEPAEQDLNEISLYIASQLLSPITAENMIDTFHESMSKLTLIPKRYPLVKDIFLASLGYRVMPVKNYLVFYSVNDSSEIKEVNIERILYAMRDWQNILKNESKTLEF